MGRPLHKKYFGNRNIGTGGYQNGAGDDFIGGEGIASIDWSTLGSFMGNGAVQVLTAIPALPTPTLPGGVQATWTMQFEVESVTTGAGKTDLAVGDTFGYASVPNLVAKVTDLSGANAIFSVTTTGASRGDALALADIPKDTQTVNMTKIAGSGTAATFTVDILFRVKESTVTITEKGSGYVGTETFTFAKPVSTVGTVPAGTIVLTTDSGSKLGTGDLNAADNQDNAIQISAYIPTANGGSSAVAGDIVKQEGSRRYKVKTAQGTGVVKLVATAPAAGEARITATDSAGGTYYVTKITAHKALVTRGTGTQFATGASVKWTFGSAVLNESIKISNA